jgi:very-short-patch-repair endonuclease
MRGPDTQATTRSRVLRRNQTDTEARLWHHLRDRRLAGCKFRRQVPLGPYFADFVCADKQLVIELDGGQHANQMDRDDQRSAYLNEQGYTVLRFWNDQVLRETDAVLEEILRHLG